MLNAIRPIIACLTNLACLSILCMFPLSAPITAREEIPMPQKHFVPDAPGEKCKQFSLVFEPDAYSSDIDLISALTDAPSCLKRSCRVFLCSKRA
jgi:hypothetical protein